MKIKNLVISAYSISLEEDISKSVLLAHDVNETHVKTCILYQSAEKISRSVFCLALLFEIKTGKSKKKAWSEMQLCENDCCFQLFRSAD